MNEGDKIQNPFLGHLASHESLVYMFLVNGIKLKGRIGGYDDFTILLHGTEGGGATQIVYKHAISAIVPQRPRDLENVRGLSPDRDNSF